MNPVLRRSAITAGVLVGLYAAAGYTLVPRLVREALLDYTRQHGFQASVESVRFNPFTLQLDVGPVNLFKDPAQPAIAISSASITLAWRSVLGNGTVVTQADVKVSHLGANRQSDGQIDLAALLPQPDPTTPWPNVVVRQATVAARDLVYNDPAHGADAQIRLDHVTVSTRDFSLRAPASSWKVDAASDQQEIASADVQLSLYPLQVHTTVSVEEFRLSRLGPSGFAVTPELEGRMGAEGELLVVSEPRPAVTLKRASLHGGTLSLKLAGEHAPELRTGHWSIGQLTYAGSAGFGVDGVTVHEPALTLTHTNDGWAGITLEGDSAPVAIGSVTIEAGQLLVTDRTRRHSVSFQFGGIGARLDPAAETGRHLQIYSQIGPQGELEVAGTLGADFRPADLGFKASHIDAVPFARYLEPFIALRIDSALVSGEGQLRAREDGWALTANAALDAVRTHDLAGEHDFLGVRHLDALGIEARWPDLSVHARQIVADGPYADVRIARDGQLNVTNLIPERPVGSAASPRPALQLTVDSAEVREGRVYFSDESQSPAFEATIGDLEGRVDGVSSDPATRAHLAFKGRVDRYAPASIEGDANLISDPIAADVRLHFENLELTGLSPYSGRIAGYRIRKGKATADLSYRVAAHRIEASHRVRLRGFELGERVAGQPGFGVPLGLVVALLKDRDGNIDLDVPLKGSLNDPDFDLGQMTRKVIGNAFGKIVAAPFALLGSLFGSGEEISSVAFEAGSAFLDSAAKEHLATLAKAMNARPGISIEIPIATTSADGDALAESRFRELLVRRAREQWGDQPDDVLLQRLQAAPEERRSVLLSLLGPAEGRADLDVATLEAKVRSQTVADVDDLEQLGSVRAKAMQAALVDGTGVSAERVFLVRGSGAQSSGGSVRLTLGLK